MSSEITPETIALCSAYKRLKEEGGDTAPFIIEWASKLGVQRPAIWRRLRSGGAVEPYKEREAGGAGRPIGGGVSGYTEKRREATVAVAERRKPPPKLDRSRDPCPYCETRGDIGCKHFPQGRPI